MKKLKADCLRRLLTRRLKIYRVSAWWLSSGRALCVAQHCGQEGAIQQFCRGNCFLIHLFPHPFPAVSLQLENLVYYNRLKNSKIVISDFHLAKLENGLIKEPCGTPEYLGKRWHSQHNQMMFSWKDPIWGGGNYTHIV